jgi:DNA polymerase-3 subunit epsilon
MAKPGGNMNFTAVDVETANEDLASICQIGLAEYEGASLVREWKSYVDPEDEFSGFNIDIHGIDETMVAGAPTFANLWDFLNNSLASRVVCSHTSFDRTSIYRACVKYHLPAPNWIWLDTARVARRAWPQFGHSGYRLKKLAEFLGYSFEHHDALGDAKASARILQAAIEQTGLDPQGWLKRVEQPLDLTAGGIAREGNPEGALFGEVLVFTGALNLPRRDAAALAALAGCTVRDNVTEGTTLLVVGDQDIKRLAGHEKSSKHRKAEALILKGQQLRILCESDFKVLVGL